MNEIDVIVQWNAGADTLTITNADNGTGKNAKSATYIIRQVDQYGLSNLNLASFAEKMMKANGTKYGLISDGTITLSAGNVSTEMKVTQGADTLLRLMLKLLQYPDHF